jgi:uncharacterized LabA/DUF88 family protein
MPPDSDGRRVHGSQTCEGAAKIINANGLELLTRVRTLIISARRIAARQINTLQVMTNFEIGRLIVEHEQAGKYRAQYGARVLPYLSRRLVDEFGRGFSRSNLEYMRRFFLEYRDRVPGIAQSVIGQLVLEHGTVPQIPQTVSGQLALRDRKATGAISPEGCRPGSKRAAIPFTLSWSHCIFLMAVAERGERRFHEPEAAQGRHKKTMIFMDFSNVFLHAKKKLEKRADALALSRLLSASRTVVQTHYFSSEDSKNPGQVKYHEFLRRNGLIVHTYEIVFREQWLYCSTCGKAAETKCADCGTILTLPPHKSKKIDIQFALTVLQLAPSFDEAVLVTGDSDFVPLLKLLRESYGRRVVVAAFKDAISYELRINADEIVELDGLVDKFCR